MKRRRLWQWSVACAAVVVMVFGITSGQDRAKEVSGTGGNHITLQVPGFVNHVYADAESRDGVSFLEAEAGMSAYTKVSGPIDLSAIAPVFRTIERQTSTYIIGSIALANYLQDQAPHVYVHKDGWIVSYYLSQDPTGKIVDWQNFDGTQIKGSKLERAITTICTQIGVTSFTATYYDYRYPNATNLMIIAGMAGGGGCCGGSDSYSVKVPKEYVFSERSWSLGVQQTASQPSGSYYLDDVASGTIGGAGWTTAQGTYTVQQFPPEVFHTIRVVRWDANVFGGLVLVYTEAAQ